MQTLMRLSIFIATIGLSLLVVKPSLLAADADTIAIHSLGHASLYIEYKNMVIHVDPYNTQADYSTLPDANLILVTHDHSDHYDLSALNNIKTSNTTLICTQTVKNKGNYTGNMLVLNNGDSTIFEEIPIKAVPAYNITSSTIYHVKGVGNGYILTLGEKRIYIAGDTEKIPEMADLGKIDIAFLPMNLPYTMTVSMAAEAAKLIKPTILYIYHYGSSDLAALRNQLSGEGFEIRAGKSVFYESDKESPVAVSVIDSQTNLNFYPNPVQGFVVIQIPEPYALFSVYDLTGHLWVKHEWNSVDPIKVDLEHLPRGTYLFELNSGTKITRNLVVKE